MINRLFEMCSIMLSLSDSYTLINSCNFIILRVYTYIEKSVGVLKSSVTSNFEVIKVYLYMHPPIITISYCFFKFRIIVIC